jgi:hypothetical protein
MSYRIRNADDFFRVIEKERKRQEKSTRAVCDEAAVSSATYSASRTKKTCTLKSALAYAKVLGMEMRLEWP